MQGNLDRRRASALMRKQGLEAMVLAQPESIVYATGAFPGVASHWRRAGAALLLVPADEGLPLAAVVGDLQAKSFQQQSGIADVRSHRIWVDTAQFPAMLQSGGTAQTRPAQFSAPEALGLLFEAMRERGLGSGPVGLDLGFVPVADFAAFEALGIRWQDSTGIVERLRAIKNPREIGALRAAAQMASAGLQVLCEQITPGMTAADMAAIWERAAHVHAQRMGWKTPQSSWAYIAVGGDGFAAGGPAAPGDIIKIDVGCVVDGYSSDGARTAVLGTPHPVAQRIFDALQRAFSAGLGLFRPGVPLRDIYRVTAEHMTSSGFANYARGHFGHGVGASIWTEEWPFIAPDSDAVLEAGMVLAFETPWYIDGLGGFIIEDQILVTESEVEVMAPLPRHLISVGT
jgi:Xaa-Pro aminopeptidase